jgi:tetratricopeptide (TPR) repeat protein
MSKTLPLLDHLLSQARRLQTLGLHHRAKVVLNRLAAFRELPKEVAEETQHRLSQLHTEIEDYPQSRRHLAAALAHRPGCGEYHFDLAHAIEADSSCPAEKALDHYRNAVRLEPDNVQYLCDFGLLAIRLGQTESGLKLLRQAQEKAPDDREVIDKLATGLADAGQADEALEVLRAAMFRNSSDRRFRDLYRKHQFRVVSDEQTRLRSIPCPGEEPAILRFRKPAAKPRRMEADGRILRLDSPEGFVGPRRHSPEASRKKRRTP